MFSTSEFFVSVYPLYNAELDSIVIFSFQLLVGLVQWYSLRSAQMKERR